MIKLFIKRLPHNEDLPLPKYMSTHAAGMDLYAAVAGELIIPAVEWRLVPTGISIALPDGFEGQVRPRSGLALKKGISVLNTPGTIDADYRGEVGIILMNHGKEAFIVKRGDRIAQLIVNKIEQPELVEVSELPETERSSGGFGHTGV
ncbi:deoxyuridine 5'-triphosphate nucleotidohydrolase [candidate division WOR-1 bacterium RIFOXYA12_FULL_43_27]|uniref:Deoxyuridine 5'-triphosphate nucleotidohydrolase n=1 Tax=candidate division WOR-1 bacterium RIFOXYC2_FULL_46_14 TaxID=1802587 RepID=A0A1F4U625_UNCSA|nr:MAG: deoxyuridine 5'-triphosphate nucleotidohydrolase [candidate division WOR-1 bacterium RIFOXYA12_FULL_43_27]OGC20554.1 MAG: deoxyuridine 5'-triphosphate nucleotidohydrolase [candidate division WOR-1 bacterium RIFOXYB2_FULL_46_45]OGC31709.1 MAG: deoxyuridine 5'-triphosphate nucleotidohydrolase [candidate division WOR-1 bacterium RIFOXYA2_FULL_46_56]OGC40396.1 MAG: deoxyuridine 5'-triphosphate nucleotidohydrolase [candidate division WOR-1 bacterium RIFOXYC2_FULL_46_14]